MKIKKIFLCSALLAMMMGSASIHAADGDMGLTFEGDSKNL